ncbi:MAG: hypothetical protein RLZZ177_91 [Pseudomonadota bacterium]
MRRRRVNALNGLRRPWHEAPLTVQFHVRLGPDLDVHAQLMWWGMSKFFEGVFFSRSAGPA